MTNLTQILVQLGALRKDGELQAERIDALHADVRAMRKENERVNAALARLEDRQCPHPGKCDQLQQTVDAQGTAIRSLEDTRTAAQGGWKTLAVLMGLAAGCGGLIVWVIQLVESVRKVVPPNFVPGP